MVTLSGPRGSRGAAASAGASNGRVLAEFELPSAPGNERQAIELVERPLRASASRLRASSA